MILYFADRHLNIIGQATTHLPEGVRVIDDLKTDDVETGVSIFECRIPFDRKTRAKVEEWTEVGNYILRSSDNENEFYNIIDSEIDTKNQEVYIYAEDDGLDLLNDVAEAYEADQPYPISSYIERFAAGAGWEIGINEVEGLTRKLSWDSEQTTSARLLSIAEGFNNCELSYSFEINGLQITKKYINIYEKRGKDTGVQLRLNKEIDSIITTKSITNLATALRATGSTLADSDVPVTLFDYEYDDGDFYIDGYVLKSRKALEKWSRYLWRDDETNQSGGHIVKSFSYDTTSQAILCEKAIEKLKAICDMEVNYNVDFSKLPENVKVGDRVNIVDDAGELYLSSRVLILETSVSNMTQRAVLGEHLIKKDGISEKVYELAAQFAANTESVKKALEVANTAKENADTALEEAENAAGAVQDAIDAAENAEEAAGKATESANQAADKADAATEAVGKVQQSVSCLQQTIDNANQAAQNAQQAAQTATQKAEEAKTAAQNAQIKAEEAAAANSEAQAKAEEAIEKANTATETAGTAKAEAKKAAAIANAAKKDALQAEADIAEWEGNLKTVTDTMSAEYSRKTDLTEATETLQSQISRNAGSIKQNILGVTVIDETANNALTTIEAAQKVATEAQNQANEASAIATEAQTAADTANAAATAAQNQADIAQAAYETAKQVADEADAALKAAEEDLATIAGRVDATEAEIAAAQKLVDEAQGAADTAKSNAKAALETATAAQEVANAAVDTATKAQANADKALNEANIAQQLADEAKGNATSAQNKVNQAQAAATTAKATADSLKAQAEAAQATADQAALNATAAQVTADKAQEQATKAATDLATAQQNLANVLKDVDATEDAVENAQADVDTAQKKANEASTYAAQAQSAANAAKNEANSAQAAADAAQAAADAAQDEAKAAQDEVDKALGIVYSLEKRVTTNETGIEQTKSEIRLFAKKDEVIQTLGDYYTKEEADSEIAIQADKVTTKVSRTYETKENVKSTLSGYYTRAETDAQIEVKSDEITSTVSSSYLTKDDYSQAQSELTEKLSEVTQTADSFDIKFTEKTTETDKEMHQKFSEIYKKISFTENGVSIGGGTEAILLTVDNDNGIIFSKNGIPFGWWDGDNFHTGNIVVEVEERAQFGNFAFIPRSDGSLAFLKVNGSSTDAHTHKYVETVLTAATCTNTGTKTVLCTGCGDNHQETIAALGHSYTSVVTPPTENAEGYTTHTCTRCGDSYKDSYTDPTGPAATYHTITVLSDNTDYGTVSGGGNSIEIGSAITISATPKSGYRFVRWNDGNTNATRTIVVTGDATYTAVFALEEYFTAKISSSGTGSGDVYISGDANGSTNYGTQRQSNTINEIMYYFAKAGGDSVISKVVYAGTGQELTADDLESNENIIFSADHKQLAMPTPVISALLGTTMEITVYFEAVSSGELTITEGVTTPVVISTAKELVYLKFVPQYSGSYTFESLDQASLDPDGYVYNSEKNTELAKSANGGAFSVTYDFTAGTTYYLGILLYSGTGTVNVKVSYNGSGGSSGGGSGDTVTMEIGPTGYGTVKVMRNGTDVTNGSYTYTFNTGDTVTVIATPNTGHTLGYWWNPDTSAVLSQEETYTFTVSSDLTRLHANFI